MAILDPDNYTIAWLAVLQIEAEAALHMLDQVHDGRFPMQRGNDYVFLAGDMCGHNVVIASLPEGREYGTGSAAGLASQVKSFFPNLWFGLLVGVAAGLPNLAATPPRDIRLGDILVAVSDLDNPGLVAYELGRDTGGGDVELLRRGQVLANTEAAVLSAIRSIRVRSRKSPQMILQHFENMKDEEHDRGTFCDPGQVLDKLYDQSENGKEQLVQREIRPASKRTKVWYGSIGSGDKLMKNRSRRDELRDVHNIIGLEMEAAGSIIHIPVGVIRGVCDYADEHKNPDWQPYAAAMAAAYAKAILAEIPPKPQIRTTVLSTHQGSETNSQFDTTNHLSHTNTATETSHFLVPFGRNDSFVGRDTILQWLLERLPPSANKDDCQTTALEGLGGVGKTQIALEAAYRVRDNFPVCSVFWVPAVDITSFENAYRAIGRALGLKEIDDEKVDVKVLVKSALEGEAIGNWLLIIDNADDPEFLFNDVGLSECLPFNRIGSILITTRNHTVALKFDIPEHIITLEEMSYPEALELLRKGLKETQTHDEESTRRLIEYLAHLPLAIRQASAYMAKTRISAFKYLELCLSSDKTFVKLLSENFEDRTRYRSVENPVATTWLITFKQILRDSPLAARYLRFICFLAEKDIPVSILPTGHDELDSHEALGTLKGYAFITEREVADSFDVHRLVRLAMQSWIKNEEENLEACIANIIFELSSKLRFPMHKNRRIWISYLPHARHVLEYMSCYPDDENKAEFLNRIGWGMCELGKCREAEVLCREAVELSKKVLGPEHPETLDNVNDLGRVLERRGKYGEAEQMHRQALELRKKVLGPEHPDTLVGINNLALVLNSLGRFEEAEQMHRSELNLSQKVQGPEHPETLVSMSNLGRVLDSLGRYKDAEQLHRQTLELRKKVLGPEHPETLNSINNLAYALGSLGRYKEAEQMHRLELSLRQKVLGPEHPSTLGSISNLGRALHSLGRYKEAEQMHRLELSLSQKLQGPEHPETLVSMSNLGRVLDSLGTYKDAEQLHRQTLELRKKMLGPEHPATLASINNLAYTLGNLGKHEVSEQMHRQALELRKNVLGPEHPNTLASIHNLACTLDKLEMYREAEQMYRRVLELRKNTLGPEHPETIASMKNLACVLNSLGGYEEAEQMHRQVFKLKEQVLELEHPDTPASMNDLALMLDNLGSNRYGLERSD